MVYPKLRIDSSFLYAPEWSKTRNAKQKNVAPYLRRSVGSQRYIGGGAIGLMQGVLVATWQAAGGRPVGVDFPVICSPPICNMRNRLNIYVLNAADNITALRHQLVVHHLFVSIAGEQTAAVTIKDWCCQKHQELLMQ